MKADHRYFTIGTGIDPNGESIKSQLINLLGEGYEIVNCTSTSTEVHYIIKKIN